jgi:uncharacterized protein YkwD
MASLIATLLLFTSQVEKDFQLSKDETRMIAAINDYRARYKLPPMAMDPTLMRVARYRAPYYTHNYQGRWIWDECRRFGFNGRTTDNLAQGQISPEEAVQGWAGSSVGHARQMLGQFKMNGRWQDYKFDKVGVARSGRNWIAIFGKQSESAAAPEKKVVEPRKIPAPSNVRSVDEVTKKDRPA